VISAEKERPKAMSQYEEENTKRIEVGGNLPRRRGTFGKEKESPGSEKNLKRP